MRGSEHGFAGTRRAAGKEAAHNASFPLHYKTTIGISLPDQDI